MADGNKETITVTGPGGTTSEIVKDFEVPGGHRNTRSWPTRIAAMTAAATAAIVLATGGLHGGREPVQIDPNPKPPAAPVQPLNP